ncbi:transglutaminaseTgpA domain-containing protein [Saccharopolyspora sp. TS4A08]|uniref:TransglutaminaseTgpA domain-containing protein n=1 Tax=Saccharopolyspora ipomoeae TaxID=3042027 RepID=A0ABT6PK49_9PSEU|nr:transglutaminaseTgpA domain-containing protein [Saccharopolyspora sp. TS4A08]MDI2028370.1 transglutaminaseTgpA domain-containing protein [Saccharopolyspora sp. TS4A08]
MSADKTGSLDTSLVAAAAAAVAVLCASASFAGVLADARWLPPALVTVLIVVGAGALGRHLGWPTVGAVAAQLASLLITQTVLFAGSSAVLGVLPGPAAFVELSRLLGGTGELIRTGVPPVPADPPLQALVCLGLGVVALLVDLIAVSIGTPAVTGLVLLCVFAIPASLADRMLPWWSFALGGAGYALLLAAGGHHRRWRRYEEPDRVAYALFGRTTAVVAGTAGVIAVLAGSVFTGVGTEGRLPGSVPEEFGGTDGIGLQPFTSLRGQLNRDRVVELFRVRGLQQDSYLRAMTLRKFDPRTGWQLDGLTQGVDAGAPLPLPEGTTIGRGRPERIEVQPIGYRDPWLPVFGTPVSVTGMGRHWRYDPAAGIVFTQTNQETRPYTQQVIVPDPSPDELRRARGPMPIDPAYVDASGISPQVAQLAQQLTADAPTEFDKAVAVNRYFTDPANGFRYDLSTAPSTGQDALSDFLFRGKRGFCEQYASSMAVLLRSVGIPSRVAVGFTAGYQDGTEQVITTEDAHAWVEAYFPGWGWQTFDPTPLSDGRTALPQFLDTALHPPQAAAPVPGQPLPAPQPGAPVPPAAGVPADQPDVRDVPEQRREPADRGWSVTLLVLVVLLACAGAATPLAVREIRRGQRLQAITEGREGAASTAWREVLDEFRDRGDRPRPTDTARQLADRLVADHELDATGADAVKNLVAAVEREWYAPASQPDGTLAETVKTITASLRESAPLDLRSRLFPRSALPPWRS